MKVTGLAAGEASLRVVATDGVESVSCSSYIYVVEDSDALIYRIYPQPVTTLLYILMNPVVTEAVVSIRTMAGEEVLDEAYPVKGIQTVKVDVRSLAAGVYTLVIETAQGNYKNVFVKQ